MQLYFCLIGLCSGESAFLTIFFLSFENLNIGYDALKPTSIL